MSTAIEAPSAPPTSAPWHRASAAYFRTDVEGLRAVAVLLVVGFHASVPLFGGGYIGVDSFFVISGYLITGLLIREAQTTGRISFRDFYARRARRILPAATVVILAVGLASLLLEPLVGQYSNARDLMSAALFWSNWHFIGLGTDYLAQSTTDSPVLHYWSLAVEEQFYLVWPLLILGAVVVARRFPLRGSQVITLVVAGVTLVSLVLGIVLTATDPSLAYMATTTRAWEFGAGGLIASVGHWLAFHSEKPRIRVLGTVVGWAGLAGLAAGCLFFRAATPFPGVAALLPVLATAAIITGGILAGTRSGTVGSLLSLAPIRYIGRLSFGWYLWHWPVLILVEDVVGELGWPQRAFLMLVALLLAAATLALVEHPISRWRTVKKHVAPALSLGLLCVVLSLSSSMSMGSSAVAALSASSTSVDEASFTLVFGEDTGANSGSVSPNPLEAPDDFAGPKDCLLDHERDRIRSCEFGAEGGMEVVLFGDSHAHQWLGAFMEMAEQRGWHLSVFAKAGCPVADLDPIGDGGRYSEPECIDWRAEAIHLITTEVKPELIIVSSLSTYLTDENEMRDKWELSLDKLRELGSPIAYIKDTPHPTDDVPTCVSGAFDDWSKCSFPATTRQDLVVQDAVTGSDPNLVVIDLTPFLCEGDTCFAVRNGYLLYRDDSHITATAARALRPAIEKALVDAGVLSSS